MHYQVFLSVTELGGVTKTVYAGKKQKSVCWLWTQLPTGSEGPTSTHALHDLVG